MPPPTVSVPKSSSYISKMATPVANPKTGKLYPSTVSIPTFLVPHPEKSLIEVEHNSIPSGAPLVVVDDVLSTGETLCAVLELLHKAGVADEDVSVMVVAELPVHGGRALLRERGFGSILVQSLMVFGGA
jgi:adenine/guanine phosphoribosyltransferase-like PRPP-binding protein